MEKEERFRVGDMVRSKDGGPPMIVGEVAPSGALTCVFYTRSARGFTDHVFRADEVHLTTATSLYDEAWESAPIHGGS